VHYTDTEGEAGILQPGGLEYMNPGGGAWHESNFHGAHEGLQAFQFWFASPPGVEDGPSCSMYLDPKSVPKGPNFKVLMGEYENLKNPFPNPSNVTIVDVELQEGDVFKYKYPEGHLTSFVFVYQGAAKVADDIRDSTPQEIFCIDSEGDSIEVNASSEKTRVIVASAVPHQWPLSLGMYSVHTNAKSLMKGQERIELLGRELAKKGLLR
jgi:redox-sensitive bicupin YhaK (pirin superfamily)